MGQIRIPRISAHQVQMPVEEGFTRCGWGVISKIKTMVGHVENINGRGERIKTFDRAKICG